MKKVIVAGAGHGGLTAAVNLARQGCEVTVFEAKKEADMGHDWHDVMHKRAFEAVGIETPPEENFLPFSDMSYNSPSQKNELKPTSGISTSIAYIDRQFLIAHLIKEAKAAGVKFKFSTKVISVGCTCEKVTGIRVEEKGKIKEYTADLVIDAAGMDSPVRRTLPGSFGVQNEIPQNETFFVWRAYYENNENFVDDPYYKILFFHNDRPGMDWVITDKSFVDILVGSFSPMTQRDVDEAVADFRKTRPYMGKMIRGGSFAKIPLRRTLSKIIANGYAAVGDSAAMTEPLSGSGITLSMYAGKCLADVVAAAGEKELTEETLWSYQYNYYAAHGNRQITNDIIKEMLSDVTADDIEFFFTNRILTEKELGTGGIPKYNVKDVLDKLNIVKKPKILPGILSSLINTTKTDKVNAMLPKYYDKQAIAKWEKEYNNL